MPDLRKFRALARNWEALGDTDPLFGVLSDPTKHGGKWDPEAFFFSGQAHVEKLMRTLADLRASFEPGQCLDFGCGVGRLTVPLSASFRHTIGVDVARPMVDAARRHQPAGARCAFIVNRDPDLRRFETGTFDMVHSCLVLQHIPADISLRYIGEFFRVSKPGGLVVFQVPAEVHSESQLSAAHALPQSAYAAALTFDSPPTILNAAEVRPVTVRVTNRGSVTWRHDIPAGRHICLGNHWLHEDGSRAVDDDVRGRLQRPVEPGACVDIVLAVQAPDAPGRYVLEMDLVQEHVCWFSERGSTTARALVTVVGAEPRVQVPAVPEPSTPVSVSPPARRPRFGWLKGLLRRVRGDTPTFEMHVIPRAEVEKAVRAHQGHVLRAVDDNAAGPGWLSYTYVCRRV